MIAKEWAMEYSSRDEVTYMCQPRTAMKKKYPPVLLRSNTEESKHGLLSGRRQSRTKPMSSLHLPMSTRDLSLKENLGISRWPPNRSETNLNRPESIQGLGSIFSWNGRREKKDRSGSHFFPPLTSSSTADMGKANISKDRENINRVNIISGPYNFRHVKHTRQEQISFLTRRPRSPIGLDPQLSCKGQNEKSVESQSNDIVDDFHYGNFSSEALTEPPQDDHRRVFSDDRYYRSRSLLLKETSSSGKNSTQQKVLDDESLSPPQTSKPQIELLPIRMSSRTALNHEANVFSKAEYEIHYPFGLPTPPSPHQSGNHEYFNTGEMLKVPVEESWPLPCTMNAPNSFGVDLIEVKEKENVQDVKASQKEEEQDVNEIQEEEVSDEKETQDESFILQITSPSLPNTTNRKSIDYHDDLQGSTENCQRLERNEGSTLNSRRCKSRLTRRPTPLDSSTDIVSWESDIDWCYENEVEADCNYRWIEDERKDEKSEGIWVEDKHGEDSFKFFDFKRQSRASLSQLTSNYGDYRKSFYSCLLLPKELEGSRTPSPRSVAFPASFGTDSLNLSRKKSIHTSHSPLENECYDLGLNLAQTIPTYFPALIEDDLPGGNLRIVPTNGSFNSSMCSRESSFGSFHARGSSSHSSLTSPISSMRYSPVESSERKPTRRTYRVSVTDFSSTLKPLPSESFSCVPSPKEGERAMKHAGMCFARHTSETLLIDRRKKSWNLDSWRASQPFSHISIPNIYSNSVEVHKGKNESHNHGRPRTRQKEFTSSALTSKLRKKRSFSHNLILRGKSGDGLFL